MTLLQKILNKFNGLHYKQDYLCLGKETFQQSLNVYLIEADRVMKDVTNSHLLSGYSPLIFTLYAINENEPLPANIELIFSQRSFQSNEIFTEKDVLARLFLKQIMSKQIDKVRVYFYEGTKGIHRFVPYLNQSVSGLNNNLFNKKAGNVFLPENLYKQVQVAYALPRKISLITVADHDLVNLFPTDLHGPINEQYYSISLRQNGKACDQVEDTRRILVSEMDSSAYKIVYDLGKNHMQAMRTKENFPFGEMYSAFFTLPVPASATKYRELELLESFDHGIHRLHLFKIISTQLIKEKGSTLAHIHNAYATWRHNNGLAGNYLFR
jgi:hypothetical protein